MIRTMLASVALLLSAAACSVERTPTAVHGRNLYAENGCANCHGQAGKGDGPIAKTLNPPPRNFTDDAAYKFGRDEASIAATLARGIDKEGSKMPAFAHLNDEERRSLALFVITLHDSAADEE